MPLYRIVGHAGLSGSSVEVCTDGKFRLHWSKALSKEFFKHVSGGLRVAAFQNVPWKNDLFVLVGFSGKSFWTAFSYSLEELRKCNRSLRLCSLFGPGSEWNFSLHS
ncbi:uncharacterized protein [Physcomitrium patens]|uniref:uncharacterized protein isoform X4 n=1 Tax=Physcomitrium patens TaxID=3218 RepID=UPI003CCE31B6